MPCGKHPAGGPWFPVCCNGQAMSWSQITVQESDFNLSEQYELLRQKAGDAGAIVLFTGLVREVYSMEPDRKCQPATVQGLTLEHYPGMTEKCLQEIAQKANSRWPLLATRIIHRIGMLVPSDQIVLVGTASAHRSAAFDAAQFLMDYLKTRAPFWKKQQTLKGSHWVESRQSDSDTIKRWQLHD